MSKVVKPRNSAQILSEIQLILERIELILIKTSMGQVSFPPENQPPKSLKETRGK